MIRIRCQDCGLPFFFLESGIIHIRQAHHERITGQDGRTRFQGSPAHHEAQIPLEHLLLAETGTMPEVMQRFLWAYAQGTRQTQKVVLD